MNPCSTRTSTQMRGRATLQQVQVRQTNVKIQLPKVKVNSEIKAEKEFNLSCVIGSNRFLFGLHRHQHEQQKRR